MENTIAERLNHVLKYIVKDPFAIFTYETIKSNTDIGNVKELAEILGKLVLDNYIEYKEVQYMNIPIFAYFSTLEGRLFIEAGGYVSQIEKDKQDSISNLFRNGIIQFGAATAGAYYLLEIARIYVVPIFQFYCHCQFVWESGK
jgi:hypothetical protein